MLVQGGNNVYDKNEMLKKRALAVKVLENNKTLTSVQQQQLLKLIREIDNTLNTVELGKLDIASNCITNVSKSAKKHMGRKLAVTGICIVMIAIIAMAVYRRNEAQRRLQEYNENIHLVSLMMIIGGSDAEEAGNLIKSYGQIVSIKKAIQQQISSLVDIVVVVDSFLMILTMH